MAYEVGHLSSSAGGKCILCGKSTSTFVSVSDYLKNGDKKNISIDIPVCDGDHFDIVSSKKDILICHAQTINAILKQYSISK